MLDPTTTSADDKVAQLLRDSGVLPAMQQDALHANLHWVAGSQGFELLHISHRHHPAVEFTVYLGNLEENCNTVRLRSQVCRLLHAASVRVSAAKVFARYRRAVVSAKNHAGRVAPDEHQGNEVATVFDHGDAF